MGARRGFLAAVTAVSMLALAACTGGQDGADGGSGDSAAPQSTDYFGYLVDTELITSNAATDIGASSNTEALSGRLYPAVFVPGPSGQMIPNTDLVRTQVLPGANRQVIYTIAEDATYSDGAPGTCTDFLLHVRAGQHEGLFGSHLPLTEKILRIDCQPGAKRFTVVFDEDGGGRWRHVFGPGTVLPSHVIAQRAGLSITDMHRALRDDDLAMLQDVASIWHDGFALAEFDPELQVSSGPFRIESVGESGEVILAPNDHYFGDAPSLDRLVVWPSGSDQRQLAESGALQIADVRVGEPEWVNRDDPTTVFDLEAGVGDLTETLRLGDAGVFAYPAARAAFAACVDQTAVAAASSRVSGIEVPAIGVHSVRAQNPVGQQLGDLPARKMAVDIGTASALAGTTVRIGYDGPDERKAAMVEAIRVSCEPAGITVVDASEEVVSLRDLSRTVVTEWGYEQYYEGSLDAVLHAVDPSREFATVNSTGSDPISTRETEERLWTEVPSIPLSAQPRVFVIDRTVGNVVVNTDLSGIGWNMDRWSRSED